MATQFGLAPVVVQANGSRIAPMDVMGATMLTKLQGSDSAGRMSVCEFTIPPRFGPPEHIHSHEDEFFYVLDGEITFLVDGRKFVAGPGAAAFGPRGVPHTFMNSGDGPARMLGVVTPSGFEEYFADVNRNVASGAELSPQLLAELMQKYGLTLVGPPLSAR